MSIINPELIVRPPKNPISRLFLNDQFLLVVIFFNAIIIFLQEYHVNSFVITLLDMICTFIFIIEMAFKHYHLGIKNYWSNALNVMDGILVILSVPSIIDTFAPGVLNDVSFLLAMRTFRIFRFFRLAHFFPNVAVIARNFGLAMRQSYAVFIALMLIILIFALISCELFGEKVPDLFGTPLDSIYSTFRLFTIEGWYDIPDQVGASMGDTGWAHFVRLYFSVLLFAGGIIGMSLVNSIFVDAMVSDNNDDVKEQLDRIEDKLRELESKAKTPQNVDQIKAQIAALTALLDEKMAAGATDNGDNGNNVESESESNDAAKPDQA